jgi:hypothetical protein
MAVHYRIGRALGDYLAAPSQNRTFLTLRNQPICLFFTKRRSFFSSKLIHSKEDVGSLVTTIVGRTRFMQAMDNWDVTLLIVAGYVAVVALVRLMARHRNQMLDDMRRQIAQERKRKQAEGEEDMRKSA